ISESPIFVPGVWGPYYSAMVPGFWLNEGGQSATGKLIEHIVRGHSAFPELQTKAAARSQPFISLSLIVCLRDITLAAVQNSSSGEVATFGPPKVSVVNAAIAIAIVGNVGEVSEACAQSIYEYLNGHLDLIKKSLPVGFLTVDLHVWPDFHGNRSPLADLTLKGMVVGLTLSQSLDDLALVYLATIQAIALGTRHIVESMQAAGHHVNTLFMCGGLSKNPLFVQMHADITGMPVVLAQEVESVLMGAAILGACASKDFASLQVCNHQ
ncbi:hypothetical protein lerEdw1_011707, partial [Lerista edwardsae]